MQSALPGRKRNSSGNVELAFLGHPFESLRRAFDPILAVIAVGRKQPQHLIGPACGRPRDIARSEIYSLSNGEFMLQRPLHHAKTSDAPTVPLQRPTKRTPQPYSTVAAVLASHIGTRQIHLFCSYFSTIFCRLADSARAGLPVSRHRSAFRRYGATCRLGWRDPPPREAVALEACRVDRLGD